MLGGVAALVVVVGGVMLTQPGAPLSPDPNLVYLGEGAAGASFHDIRPGQAYSDGSAPVCLDPPGRVEVVRIEAADPTGGMRVDGFAVAPLPVMGGPPFANVRGPLNELGVDATKRQWVTAACFHAGEDERPALARRAIREGRGASVLFVQYSKRSTGTATDGGLRVTYRSGGRLRDMYVPFHTTFCAEDDDVSEYCR